jgi:hypothetical protein
MSNHPDEKARSFTDNTGRELINPAAFPDVQYAEESPEMMALRLKIWDREFPMEFGANGERMALPSMFPNNRREKAYNKAQVLNLFVVHGGNWKAVVEDPNCPVTRERINIYLGDEDFREYIDRLYPFITMRAVGTVIELMDCESDSVRLQAALRWLEAHEGEKWDKGIRKQIVANKGSIATEIFAKAVNQESFLEALSKDPFMPETVKQAVSGLINEKPKAIEGEKR